MTKSNMNKNDVEIEAIAESRSWKERKKFKRNLGFQYMSSDEIPLQNFKKSLSLKSSGSTQDKNYPKHNHVPRLRREERNSSKITIYPHYLNPFFDVYISIFIKQLLICMPKLSSSLCSNRKMPRKKCFYENNEKLWKQNDRRYNPLLLHCNLMGVCSLSSMIFSLIALMSTISTGCYALKNEFCKSTFLNQLWPPEFTTTLVKKNFNSIGISFQCPSTLFVKEIKVISVNMYQDRLMGQL